MLKNTHRHQAQQHHSAVCVLADVWSSTSLSSVMFSATFRPVHHSAMLCCQRRLVHYITQQYMFSATFGPVHHSAVYVLRDVWSITSLSNMFSTTFRPVHHSAENIFRLLSVPAICFVSFGFSVVH